MKHLLYYAAVLSLLSLMSAQITAQELISNSGTSVTNGNTQLDYSVGETVVSSHTQSNDQLTQGFLQGNVTVSYTTENLLQLSLFPNPNNGIFFLSKDNLEPLTYKIYSIQRELLNSGAFNSLRKQFDLSDYTNGTYFLEVFPIEDETQKTILKIVKTN